MADLVISCMALAKIPSGVNFAKPPRILHWMPPTTPGKHPSWTPQADAWREPPYRKGRLLPELCSRFGIDFDAVERIAAFGFSAGSNNGLRELLRNVDDRQRFSAVFAVDGLHPNLRPVPLGTGPRARYAAWDAELEPFADFATAAAFGERLAVFTASDVAAPSKLNGKTADVTRDLVLDVRDRTNAAGLPPWTGPLEPAGAFPTGTGSPKPIDRAGSRGFACYWYAGADAAAHIRQGKLVTADLWRDFLAWLWSPETAGGTSPPTPSEPSGPVAIRPIAVSTRPATGGGLAAGVVSVSALVGGLAGWGLARKK